MPRNAQITKQRILDAAAGLVLDKGFSATSVDAIQEAAEISRGTFFYHFPTKHDLATALLVRYADVDASLTDGFMARAEKLATDPLQQALVFIGFYEELMEETGLGEAGCLFASYVYEAGLFDEETHTMVLGSVAHWRRVLGGKLEEAIEHHGIRSPGSDPYVLADLTYGVFQGAFILGRLQADPGLMVEHLKQIRVFLRLLIGAPVSTEAVTAGRTP